MVASTLGYEGRIYQPVHAGLWWLDLLGQIKNPNDMKAIRDLISDYSAQKAEDAIDALWDEGKITSETIENWKYEHMRSHVGLWVILSSTPTDDNKFVDCAVRSGAQYIVTEDHHYDVLKTIPLPQVDVLDIDSFLLFLSVEKE